MLRKALNAIVWTAAGLVGLVVLLYLVALAINWRDREPSAAARHLAQVSHDRPAVADDNNGYVYVTQWKLDPDRRLKLSARLQKFLKDCVPSRPECAVEFDQAADDLLADWTAADGALLDAYLALTARTGWRESATVDVGDAVPPYSGAGDGQRMLLMRARALAKQGDADAVRHLLERDLQFWRMVLRSSDILISKMVATSMLNRHFEWGNFVLRGLPPAQRAAAIPEGWRTAISDDERSMARCMAGEWLFASAMLRRVTSDSFGVTEETAVRRAVVRLGIPLYQEQDTINLFAEHHLLMARAFHVPLDKYPAVVAEMRKADNQLANELVPWGAVYNLPGAWLFAFGLLGSDMTGYFARVGDIEGVRRAALTAATLRASGVESRNVSAALANAGQRDPYTNQPLVWDEASQAIVFTGLERGERHEHRIYY
jgi:hypothetical protein